MKILLDENGIRRSITRISYEIIERNKTVDNIVLVGIKSRGDILAERIKQKLKELENIDVPLETIDITYYRDDIDRKNFGIKITKLASGIPMGGNLEFSDTATISRALDDRVEI